MVQIIIELSRWIVPGIIVVVPLWAYLQKVPVYEAFIEGAKEGFTTAIKTIPFLVAMLVAISLFRASGAMELLVSVLEPITKYFGIPGDILPLAIMRPLSGSGALGITTELISTYGPDSLIGRLASTMQGSADTTFYVLTLYFGSVGVVRYRYALYSGLLGDLTGFLASVYIVHKLF